MIVLRAGGYWVQSPRDFTMAKHLDGDRKRLDQDGSGRFGFQIWIVLGVILAGIAFAVWRHVG